MKADFTLPAGKGIAIFLLLFLVLFSGCGEPLDISKMGRGDPESFKQK